MKTFPVRALLSYTTADLWTILDGPFAIRFDDGDLETNAKETLFSSYAWDFFRLYPNTPILKQHHLTTILKGGWYTSDSHLQLFNSVFWSVFDAYRAEQTVTIDTLSELAYEKINEYYNDLILRCEEYVVGLDWVDFLQIANHPEIIRIKAALQPTYESIQGAYEEATQLLRTAPELDRNAIARAVRSKTANVAQVMQCIVARGFIIDMDANRFPMPVLSCYMDGITGFRDSLTDSRSASVALANTGEPLKRTEYFARRLQLVSSTLRNLHYMDCGSQQYLEWTPQRAVYDDGHLLRQADLLTLAGKYYLDEETNQLKAIKATDEHLYGKPLKLRSHFGRCAHPDPYGFCSTCYGQTAESIPPGGNVGQTNTAEMTQQSGQLVISTKHLLANAAILGASLTDFDRQYLRLSEDRAEYLLQPSVAKLNPVVIFPAAMVFNILNIAHATDVDAINASRVAEISAFAIGRRNEKGEIIEEIAFDVGNGKRAAHFTYPLLRHIQKRKWTMSERGSYVIDLEGWDYSESLLALPMRFQSMGDHAQVISDMVESSIKELGKRAETESPDKVLFELHEHVNAKLFVPLAVLETILLSAMAVSVKENDYSMPKVGTNRMLSVMRATMRERSLSVHMAYQQQKDILIDPRSYVYKNRLSNGFDYIITPNQVADYGMMDQVM